MEQFAIVSQQLFIFAVYVCIGAACVKCKIFNEGSLSALSKFIINVTMPTMIFCNLLSGPALSDLLGALPIFVIYLASFIVLYLSNCVIVKFFHFEERKANAYKALATFSNAGFMGIPLIFTLFKEKGGVFMSLCIVVDQLMLWTLGVKLTSNAKISTTKSLKKFINPALISIFVSLLGLALNFRLPTSLQIVLKPVGAMTPVLSLIYIGGLFCYSDVKKHFKNVELYVIILFKMVIFPVAIWLVLRGFAVQVDIVKTVVLLEALPAMTSIAIFAKNYENYGEYAAAAVLITTAASLITVPLVSLLTVIV